MRMTRRLMIVLSGIGFVALFLLQYRVALATTPLILVVGALAGLMSAKWMPWAWYGRQFVAGIRVAVLPCALSAAGILVSLMSHGPVKVADLATRSHLPGLDLGRFVTALGSGGWFMPYLLLTLFFGIGGVLIAGLLAQITGWSKNLRTVRVIRAAHDSAAALHRHQTWAPASNSLPSIGGYWNSVLPSAGPVSQPGSLAPTGASMTGRPAISHAPVSATHVPRAKPAQDAAFEQQPVYLRPLPPLDIGDSASAIPLSDMPDVPDIAIPEPIPPRRSTSGAQPVQFALTDDLRSALDRWQTGQEPTATDEPEPDEESGEPKKAPAKKSPASKARTPAKHRAKASAYLNSEPPAAPRRNRKKQNTRDWLC